MWRVVSNEWPAPAKDARLAILPVAFKSEGNRHEPDQTSFAGSHAAGCFLHTCRRVSRDNHHGSRQAPRPTDASEAVDAAPADRIELRLKSGATQAAHGPRQEQGDAGKAVGKIVTLCRKWARLVAWA